MFKGEEVVSLPAGLSDEQVRANVEESLSKLGRVRIDKRGEISIEPRDKFGSFMTDVTMTGQIRKKSGGSEVSVSYNCKPSVANWIISIILFLFTCVGGLVLLVSMGAKGPVGTAVRGALADLEDAVGDGHELT